MKYYLNALGIFLFICLTFGLGVPTLVSAKDNLLIIAGFAWVFASPVVIWYWARKAFMKPLLKKLED